MFHRPQIKSAFPQKTKQLKRNIFIWLIIHKEGDD